MPDRLTEILDGLQARLEGGLRGNRAAVTHPGARGEASEEDWLRVLNDHLPRRYQADRAFVIDSRGECSDQIDIVIYDREYSPFLYNQANQRYVPAESVYGILEVKQDLTREHLLYAGAKAASVRRLHRTSAPIPYAEGAYKPRPLPRIVAGVVLDCVYPLARDHMAFPELLPLYEPHKVREVYVMAWENPQLAVDISETMDLKLKALACHESQFDDFGPLEARVRDRAAVLGRAHGYAYAETFDHVVMYR